MRGVDLRHQRPARNWGLRRRRIFSTAGGDSSGTKGWMAELLKVSAADGVLASTKSFLVIWYSPAFYWWVVERHTECGGTGRGAPGRRSAAADRNQGTNPPVGIFAAGILAVRRGCYKEMALLVRRSARQRRRCWPPSIFVFGARIRPSGWSGFTARRSPNIYRSCTRCLCRGAAVRFYLAQARRESSNIVRF